MKKLTLALLTAALLCSATLVGGIAPASADDGESGGDAIIRTGNCSGRADWKLKAKARDGGYEVEFEVDSNRRGQVWRYSLRQNGLVLSHGTRTTQLPSGSFSVERRAPNTSGADTFVGTATNVRTGQTCRGTLTV
jgi:hypothetical protein